MPDADVHGGLDDVLGAAAPGGIDEALVHDRVLAALFGVQAPSPRFGRFELRERIGMGGMGVVYRGWDPQLERAVAIKLIDVAGLDDDMRTRALREARSLAKLSHPNVITVFEAGLSDDQVWIAMEYVPGTTMRDWLTRTPGPDPQAILRQWIDAGRGLLAVHRAGLIHGDVKPNNVLIGDDGRARLIDFGLVRAPRTGDSLVPWIVRAQPVADRAARVFLGTRAYAAPEQLAGELVGPAADQYALCVSLVEALCGRRPQPLAPGESLIVPDGVKLDPRVHRALARGLALAPHARFPSLEELLDELGASMHRSSRWRAPLIGGAIVGALAIGVVVARIEDTTPASPCAIDAAAMHGTWDDTRREHLHTTLASSDLAFAGPSVDALARGLDDWTARWLDARRSACAATWIEGVQSQAALDLRSACLERKRRALQVTLDTLLGGDAAHARSSAAHAPEVLAVLPRIDDCADPQRLAEIEPLPPAGAEHDAIQHAYDVLAQAQVLAAAGAVGEAHARVGDLGDDASAARGYPPLQLELEAFVGRLDLLRERTSQGVPVLLAVAREAEARRLDELAASLRVELAEAAAGRWSKPAQEQWLVDEAEVALRRLDRPTDARTVSLQIAKGRLLAQSGRLDEALATHQAAHDLAVSLGDDARAEGVLLAIAARLADLGRFDEARAALEVGRTAAATRWGADSPMVGNHEFDLALLALDTGDFADAQVRLDRAERIFRAAFGGTSLAVAEVTSARAKLAMADGRFAEGLALVDAALAVYVAELGESHEQLADLHEARGVLRFFTGDMPGSIGAYTAALRIREGVMGPEHPALARLHANLGESQLALDRRDDARASFDRALGIYAATLPADHPDLAMPLKGRGQVALASGDAARAVEDLERALAMQIDADAEPLEIADLRFSLARALTSRDDQRSTRATTLAAQARDDFDRRGMHEKVAAIDAWMRR